MKKLCKAFLITALAFLLSTVLLQPFSASVGALFSSPERNDFTVSDFYNLVADNRAVSRLDTNIVIVNLDRSDRAEIAYLLDMISLGNPKAVGLDVTFADEREGDAPLLEAIARTRNLVQPLTLEPIQDTDSFRLREASYFFSPEHPEGFASSGMPSKFANSTIREMKVDFPTRQFGSLPSFASAVAAKMSPQAVEKLKKRGNSLETIRYHSRRFLVLEPDEVADNLDRLTGRAVLLGAMHERGDLHPTPVNSLMPGIEVHAHALATILDGSYMRVPPKAVRSVVAFCLCFLMVYACVAFKGNIRGLILRILQIGLLYVVMQVGYWLFVRHNVVLDFTTSLLMLTFGIFAVDVWNGLGAILKWLGEKCKPLWQKYSIRILKTITK